MCNDNNNVYNVITTILIIIILIYDRDNQPPQQIHVLKALNDNTCIITPNRQNMLYRHDFKALIRISGTLYLRPRLTQLPFEYIILLWAAFAVLTVSFLGHRAILCRRIL